jgi:hypothetical protein
LSYTPVSTEIIFLMLQKILQTDNPRLHPFGFEAEPALIQQKNFEGR